MDEPVVGGIGPAGVVLPAVRNKDAEKGVGIEVIADPAGAGELVEFTHPLVIENTALLVGEVEPDAQILPPHLLDDLGDGLVPAIGGESDVHGGKALSVLGAGR